MSDAAPVRLAALPTTLKGDALLDKEEELLLCTLPFPENNEITDSIRKAHPHTKIVYHALDFNLGSILLEKELPNGKSIDVDCSFLTNIDWPFQKCSAKQLSFSLYQHFPVLIWFLISSSSTSLALALTI
jgi:hypothetical protein